RAAQLRAGRVCDVSDQARGEWLRARPSRFDRRLGDCGRNTAGQYVAKQPAKRFGGACVPGEHGALARSGQVAACELLPIAVVALDHVSLAIDAAEMVSIIGPSGSGKSTLLNLVGGLDHPTSGTVTVGGEILDRLADDELARVRRDKIGFIFQFFNLLPTLS